MDKTSQNNFQELAENITRASLKIIRDYLENSKGYAHDNRDIALTFNEFSSKLSADSKEMKKVQDIYDVYLQNQQELWKRILERQFDNSKEYKPVISPDKNDKRFRAPEWDEAPYLFDFVKQSYLLVSKMMKDIIDNAEIDEKSKKKLGFFTKQYVDAFSPSNFFATNPEAIKLAQQTKGQSLIDGFRNLMTDINNGGISQTDMKAFEVGKNIALTPGAVIFENELIQLIQYTSTTKTVCESPIVIVPPCINKYYILDLQPGNSFVKYIVDQGVTTFIISWKNPNGKMGNTSFDDYVETGVMKAIEVAKDISKAKKVNTLGYCIGGTMLATALSLYSKHKSPEENPANTATLLAAMIDFSDVGPMGDVIDNALVQKLERGELVERGIMSGHEMEKAFNLIRANDLIWSFVINNYLKGKNPVPFDLLFWTNDNTNLPAKMYLYYLRNMVLENKLSRKNALRICKTPIDIGKIEVPTFIIGLREDHISPPHTAFTTTELVSGHVEFILGGSGHVMGIANPPAKKKYGYHVNGTLHEGFEKWKETSVFQEGSWWTSWIESIKQRSGKQVPARKNPGNEKYKKIEPAPGRYVREKAHH